MECKIQERIVSQRKTVKDKAKYQVKYVVFKEEWMVQENQRCQIVKKQCGNIKKLLCSFAKDREIPIKIEMFSYVKNWMRKSRSRWRNILWSVRNETDKNDWQKSIRQNQSQKRRLSLKLMNQIDLNQRMLIISFA